MALTPEQEARLEELNSKAGAGSNEMQDSEPSPDAMPLLASSNFNQDSQSRLDDLNSRAGQPDGLAAENQATARDQEPPQSLLQQGMSVGKRGISAIGRTMAENPGEIIGGAVGGVAAAGLATATAGASLPATAGLVGLGAGGGKLIQENIENVARMIKGKDVKGTQEVLTEAGVSGAINAAFPFLARGAGEVFKFTAKAGATTAGISQPAQEIILSNPQEVGRWLKTASVEQTQALAKSVGPIIDAVKDTAGFAYEHIIENGLVASKGRVFDVKEPMVKAVTESLVEAGFEIVKKSRPTASVDILGAKGQVISKVARETGEEAAEGLTIKLQEGTIPTTATSKIKRELEKVLSEAGKMGEATPRMLYNFQKSLSALATIMFKDGNKRVGRSIMKSLDSIRKVMDENVSEFRQANKVWSDVMSLADDADKLIKTNNPTQLLKQSLSKATRVGDAIQRLMDKNPQLKSAIESALQSDAAEQMLPRLSPRPTGFIPGSAIAGAVTGGPIGTAIGTGVGLAASSPRLTGQALRMAGFGSKIAGEIGKSPGASGAVAGTAAAGSAELQELVRKFMANRKKK